MVAHSVPEYFDFQAYYARVLALSSTSPLYSLLRVDTLFIAEGAWIAHPYRCPSGMMSILLSTTEVVYRLCDLPSLVPTGCAPPSSCSPLLPGVSSLSSCLLVLPRMVQFLLVEGAAWLWVPRQDFCVGILATCPSAPKYPPAESSCQFWRTTSRLLLLVLHGTEPSSRFYCADVFSWRDHHLKAQLLFKYAPQVKTLSPA